MRRSGRFSDFAPRASSELLRVVFADVGLPVEDARDPDRALVDHEAVLAAVDKPYDKYIPWMAANFLASRRDTPVYFDRLMHPGALVALAKWLDSPPRKVVVLTLHDALDQHEKMKNTEKQT